MALTPGRRAAVLLRDGHRCTYCHAPGTAERLHAGHVVPPVHGGPDDLWNLVATCPRCDLAKGWADPDTGLPWSLRHCTVELAWQAATATPLGVGWRTAVDLLHGAGLRGPEAWAGAIRYALLMPPPRAEWRRFMSTAQRFLPAEVA